MKKVLLAAALTLSLTATSFAQEIPRQAGPWKAQTVDKKTLTLDPYKGKYVLLAFLLTTCPHCQKFTGVLNQIQAEFASKGVVVVGGTFGPPMFGTQPDPTGALGHADFVQRFAPAFPIGAMDQGMLMTFGQWGPKRTFMPMAFFIDKTGVVRSQFMGSDSLFEGDPLTNVRAELTKLIALKPSSAKTPVTKK